MHRYPCLCDMVCSAGHSRLLQGSGSASASCALKHQMMIPQPWPMCIDSTISCQFDCIQIVALYYQQCTQWFDLLWYDPTTKHRQNCLPPQETNTLHRVTHNLAWFQNQIIPPRCILNKLPHLLYISCKSGVFQPHHVHVCLLTLPNQETCAPRVLVSFLAGGLTAHTVLAARALRQRAKHPKFAGMNPAKSNQYGLDLYQKLWMETLIPVSKLINKLCLFENRKAFKHENVGNFRKWLELSISKILLINKIWVST